MNQSLIKRQLKDVADFLHDQLDDLISWIKRHKKIVLIATIAYFIFSYLFSEDEE